MHDYTMLSFAFLLICPLQLQELNSLPFSKQLHDVADVQSNFLIPHYALSKFDYLLRRGTVVCR